MASLINRLRNSPSMGLSESSPVSVADLNKRNREIDSQLEKDRKQLDGQIKLLLLGAAESGKSTILKQMKVIHDKGYSKDELVTMRSIVYINCVSGMISYCDALKILGENYSKDTSPNHEEYLRNLNVDKDGLDEIGPATFKALMSLWSDKGIQNVREKKTMVYLFDSADYFMDNLERIYLGGYVPSTQDIIRTRVSTMGVIEVKFRMKNKNWRVFDVGGQRSQRKKWIHCFDDVKAVIYVVALSEYDQKLKEDETTNRMQESLQLFEQVCNNKHFLNTNMILFLNKKDLFEAKLPFTSIKEAFKEYPGDSNYETCVKYIRRKFEKQNKNKQKVIYSHVTCATDTQQVEFVLDSTLDTILSAKLKGCGLY
ncbi:gpa-1 [Pristionchus pacificus]|uniref:ADP ribosylation factor n=1 Tax=Pristionchus pacificus TaxID=54126 RepID=A0A2A6C135_PRIPA|nr:gpa-1 [Pristionchus pacificus]|eukprot:PDM71741.1 ADP ribosylation factor [Pristionchus pacificus]